MSTIFFSPTQYTVEIVGEANCQKAIRKIVMYKETVESHEMEDKMTNMLATLVLENDNKFDPGNAVRVDIEDQTVGYLAKEDARIYRENINKLGLTTETCTCYSSAYGKRDTPGKMMNYGIWLSIDINNLVVGIKPRKKFLGIF